MEGTRREETSCGPPDRRKGCLEPQHRETEETTWSLKETRVKNYRRRKKGYGKMHRDCDKKGTKSQH